MRLKFIVLNIFLASPLLINPFISHAETSPSYMGEANKLSVDEGNAKTVWWEKYQQNAGFIEALTHIGYSLKSLNDNIPQALLDSNDGRTPLFWLKRTMYMYPYDKQNEYNMPVVHRENNNWTNSLYSNMGRGMYYFTRTQGYKGDRVKIRTEGTPVDAHCYVATGSSFVDKNEMYLDEMLLTENSEATYTFKRDGVLLLGCGDNNKQQTGEFVKISVKGGSPSNVYILGLHTQSDWDIMRRQLSNTGFALMSDGRSNVVVGPNIANVTSENIGESLSKSLRISAHYERVNGLDGSEAILTPSQSSLFLNYDRCCFADYNNGYAGVGFHSDRMISRDNKDWGLWHELGHLYEPWFEYYRFPEIQVNRYSIEACRILNNNTDIKLSECGDNLKDHYDWDPLSVQKFLASNESYEDYSHAQASDPHWLPLRFLTYLRFTYGEEFFAKVNQERLRAVHAVNRDTMWDRNQAIMGGANLNDFLVLAYSKAAGRDLRDYFVRWGMKFSQDASDKVEALRLPKPEDETAANQPPVADVSRNEINAVATADVPFGYGISASSNQQNVVYKWEAVAGDAGIYVKYPDRAQTDIVIKEKVENVNARFRLTVTNTDGKKGENYVNVSVVSPQVVINGGSSMENTNPLSLSAKANFDYGQGNVQYSWKLLQASQIVPNGIDQNGKIKTGLAAGNYVVESTAYSEKGQRHATSIHSINVTDSSAQDLPNYKEGTDYKAGDKVKATDGGIYQCKPWPTTPWCAGAAWAYAPATGLYWTEAWDRVK